MRRLAAALVMAVLAAGCLPRLHPRFTELANAAREGDVSRMQTLLAGGANPNARDPEGNHWTPLQHAIHKGQLAAVELLLRSGANPGDPGNDLSPLLMAVGTGQPDIVGRLLDAGADPRADETIFLTAVSGGAFSDLDNPLLGRCNTEVVRVLLQRAPDLRIRPGVQGRIALLFAGLNHCDGVLRLVRVG